MCVTNVLIAPDFSDSNQPATPSASPAKRAVFFFLLKPQTAIMKTRTITFLMFILLIIPQLTDAAGEMWRSRVSGSWTTPSTWEFSTNGGGTWITATSTFPDVTGSTVTIQTGHAITVSPSTPLGIDQFTINGGASLTLGTGSELKVNDGSGDDLTLFGTINGPGIMRTTGFPTFVIRNGSAFNAWMYCDSGNVNIRNDDAGNTSDLYGRVYIAGGKTFAVQNGGYTVRVRDNLTNFGTITGAAGATFRMLGGLFTSEGTVQIDNFYFDDTTGIAGLNQVWRPANAFISGGAMLTALDTISFKPTAVSNFSVNSGGVLNLNSRTVTFDGTSSGIFFTLFGGGTVTGGLFRTKGNITMRVKNGSAFNSPFRVYNGITTIYNDDAGNSSDLFGNTTVDAGAVLAVNNGGYTVRLFGNLVNSGTISGTSGASFRLRGSTFNCTGTVAVENFHFDTTTSFSGTPQSWRPANTYINTSGNVTVAENISFISNAAVSYNIGGMLNLSSNTLTVEAAVSSALFSLNGGGTVTGGLFRTKGLVTLRIRNNSNFSSPLEVATGNTVSFSDESGNTSTYFNNLTVNSGATFAVENGGYTSRVLGNVTNNGTIGGASGASFRMLGQIFTSNGTVSVSNFIFDDTTSFTGAAQNWQVANTSFNTNSLVTIGDNVRFNPTAQANYYIGSSARLDLNSRNVLIDAGSTSVNFYILGGGRINSGQLQTKGSVTFIVKNNTQFDSRIRVLTGTLTALNDESGNTFSLNNSITVDTSAAFMVNNGGYTCIVNDSIINRGTIGGFSGATLKFYGPEFINHGNVNVSSFYFDGILVTPTAFHNVSGTGQFTSPGLSITNGSYVKLLSDHSFSSVTINAGGVLDLGGKTMKLTGGGFPMANNGGLLAGGATIEFNGTTSQTLNSSFPLSCNLRVNNPAGVFMANSLTLSGMVTLVSGDLDLNGNVLTLDVNASLSETNGNTVKGNSGTLLTVRNLNAPSNLNVAGMGAIITTAQNMGITEIRRSHSAQILPTGNSILRLYSIKPQNNASLNATLRFTYDASELNSLPENSLGLFTSTNAGASYFVAGGTRDTALNRITLSGISSFSRYTAGSSIGGVLNLTVAPQGLYNDATQRLRLRDSVTVELHSKNSPFVLIDVAKTAIDSITLIARLEYAVAPSDTYYVVVKTRNTIETWSKTNGYVHTGGGVSSYNFTSAQTQAFGSNLVLTGTKWTLYSGDVNSDGTIDASDLSAIDNDAYGFVSGYVRTDLNGDGFVDGTDYLLADNNAANFISVIRP